jgi:putative hydrolase of HD superfamily
VGRTRLRRQLDFVLELDRLKGILRRTLLVDRSRRENSAEHSWHISLMAVLLHEYASQDVDLLRVLELLLVHDVVEIEAGDTYCYAPERGGQAEVERGAARRLFAQLPEDQEREMIALWEEFEARETAEACFAAALDRLQPLLHNFATDGQTWRENGIRREQVVERCRPIGDGAPELWKHAAELIEEASARGLLAASDERPAGVTRDG